MSLFLVPCALAQVMFATEQELEDANSDLATAKAKLGALLEQQVQRPV